MGFEFKLNLETKYIFENGKELFLKGFDGSFILNLNQIQKQTLSTHIINLEQYIRTKK
jgi:hypothetical protein